ncbi:MAG: YlmH/Sll1252 family protein [Eubacteriales bacterium]|nr:YlmH/Sll1252 family protein [Eubacteriales bacterium]
MTENDILKAHIRDLDRAAYQKDILRATGFLSLSELAVFNTIKHELNGKHTLYGGYGDAERVRIVWVPSYLDEGLSCGELVSLIKVSPVNAKFSDDLTHRDFLGALMNLSIERSKIGDILVQDNVAYIFADSDIAGLITDELTSVKHTSVSCELFTSDGEAGSLEQIIPPRKFKELKVNTASERLDAILAAVWKLSRSDAAEFIKRELVFIDGVTASSVSGRLKEGSRISVRGKGKFIYDGIENETKRGRLYVKVSLFQ